MATVTIEIEENEFNLFDYALTVNGETVGTDDNYTSEDGAEYAAKMALDTWFTSRV